MDSKDRLTEDAATLRRRAEEVAREGAVTAREDAATLREGAAGVREDAVGLREETSTLREDTATQREDAASVREEVVQVDLRDSRDMLAQTGRMAKIGGWQLDADTETLVWTGEVYDIHEVDPATKVTVAEAIQFYAPESRPVITAAVQAAINAGTSFDLELPLITARGRHIWVRALGIAEHLDGKTIRVHGAFQDITERKRADEALRESEQKFRAYVEHAPDGVFVIDGAGFYQDANVAACRLLGYSTEELLHMHASQIVPEEAVGEIRTLMDALRRDGLYSGELTFLRKDGSRFVGLLSATRINEDRHLGFVKDITARKRAEEEKETLNAQLQQAQKMESVGRLAGGVAHDFNNMLAVILGYTELVLRDLGPAQPLYDDLLAIQSAANRSADLTHQLLAFARKQTVTPMVLDLNETVGRMLAMLRRVIGEDIDLAWRPGENLWPIKVDPSQIDQMVANLCVNARDAIGGVGKVTIETANTIFDDAYCMTHAGCAPGEYVRLVVSDDGCGMDKDTLSHLFEPFFTTKVLGKGTGLGLATVFGAVKQNRGFINVYSEPGKGTSFTIYLPRHGVEGEPIRPKGAAEPASRGDETILLVEDDPAILKMTTRMLAGQGYTVLAADSPVEAIRLAGECGAGIHLLITDVVMPEMNGRDLAVKLLSLYPNLKRLFTSGYTVDVIARHGVLDEGVHFLQKPFSVHDLAAKVRAVLDHA